MKSKVISLLIVNLIINLNLHSQSQTLLFDSDWKFHRGGAQYAEQPGFDDSSWRKLDQEYTGMSG